MSLEAFFQSSLDAPGGESALASYRLFHNHCQENLSQSQVLALAPEGVGSGDRSSAGLVMTVLWITFQPLSAIDPGSILMDVKL